MGESIQSAFRMLPSFGVVTGCADGGYLGSTTGSVLPRSYPSTEMFVGGNRSIVTSVETNIIKGCSPHRGGILRGSDGETAAGQPGRKVSGAIVLLFDSDNLPDRDAVERSVPAVAT
jgi:hypothetical protein